jgi:hypothetical protein
LQLQIWNEKGWQWNVHAGASHPSNGGYTWYEPLTFATYCVKWMLCPVSYFIVSNISACQFCEVPCGQMYIGPIIVAMVTNLENKYNTNENLQNQHQ